MNRFYDSTAYDFERFAPKKPQAKVVRLPEKRKNPRAVAAQKLKSRLKAAAAAAVVMTLVIVQIHGQIKNSELAFELNKTNANIAELRQEESRLNVKYNSTLSFNNIEKVAEENGMQKASAGQTEYISICDEDAVELPESDKNIFEQIADMF